MDAMAVSLCVDLTWDDFLWLNQPTPTPPDVVKGPLVAPILTAAPQGGFNSDSCGFCARSAWATDIARVHGGDSYGCLEVVSVGQGSLRRPEPIRACGS